MLVYRQINGTFESEVPDLVFDMNQEYKIVISQTLVGDRVRIFNKPLCFSASKATLE